MIDASTRALLDAVVGVAAEFRLPDVLRRTVESARRVTGAGYGALAGSGPLVEDGEPPSGGGTLAVPVHLGDNEFGRLCVAGRDFTEHDRARLETLASAASIAIGNADRHERTLRRERWREASHEVTLALLNGQDGEAALQTIATWARVVAQASCGAVALPSESDPDALVYEVIASPHAEYRRLTGAVVPLAGTASGDAYTTGEPVVVTEYGEHAALQQAQSGLDIPSTIADIDSAVAVPLVAGTEKLGVLLVARSHDQEPFSEAEVELVRDFAAHAALAIAFAHAEDDRRRLVVFEERDRIARDLHDLVIQRLFAIGLGLEGLGRQAPEIAEQVHGFVRDLDRTIRDVRNSIFSLQEPADSHGGIRSDLLRMAHDSTTMFGFEPRVSFDGPLDAAVTGPLRGDLMATVREALSNVARHAQASSVSIEVDVDRDGDRLSLTVVDDGVGVPAESAHADGLGALRRRAERWHGTLTLEPRPEGGTKLAWTAVLGE